MNVLMIGGTGFLGTHIVSKLIQKKHRVFILTRDTQKQLPFSGNEVVLIHGDITNVSFSDTLPHEIDTVVYVAMPPFKIGRISEKKFKELTELTEVYFRNTIELAKRLKAVLILTSGTSYITKPGEVADETWPIARIGMPAIGKAYDKLVCELRREGCVPLIELLPGQIYGNGGKFQQMIDMAKKGKVVVFGDGRNYMPRIHVDDCAEAYVLAIEKRPIGKRYIVSDDTPCTTKEFGQFLAEIFHAKRVIYIPRLILRLVLGKHIYHTIMMNAIVTNQLIKNDLGWKPQYQSYKEGLRALKQNGK